MTDVGARAARWASNREFGDLPEAVLDRSKLILLDTVGIGVWGARRDYIRNYARGAGLVRPERGSTEFATFERRSPTLAAAVNATAASSTEYYEGTQGAGMAGIHVVPAGLAIAEAEGKPGRELLRAVILGYEVGTRVADLNRPMKEGLHPHGAAQPVGVAVTAGVLFELDEAQLAEAIRIAANPFVVGHWDAIRQGRTIRNVYSGVTAEAGTRAASLAAAGVTGVESAVAECLFPGTAASPPEPATVAGRFDDLGDRWWTTDNLFKPYPCARYTHAPLEAVDRLVDDHEFTSDDVKSISVRTTEIGTYGAIQAPVNEVDAKYSTCYVLAARLVLGQVTVAAFEPEAIANEAVRELARRVSVEADSAFEQRADRENKWGANVAITLDDGTTIKETVLDASAGHDADPDELHAKFDRLVGDATERLRVDRFRRGLANLEDVGNVRALVDEVRVDDS